MACTPMDRSTATIRSTSTIRATPRKVVRPRLSSEAHSRATAPFLEDFTVMVPERFCPPVTRRWEARGRPRLSRSASKAWLIRPSSSTDRFCPPFSIRATALWLVPSNSANWVWVSPLFCRAPRMRAPISGTVVWVCSIVVIRPCYLVYEIPAPHSGQDHAKAVGAGFTSRIRVVTCPAPRATR